MTLVSITDKSSEALFIDEIHRLTKPQQDILLPYVEEGVILLGATTENPSFSLTTGGKMFSILFLSGLTIGN